VFNKRHFQKKEFKKLCLLEYTIINRLLIAIIQSSEVRETCW